jgi:hypothetical protein
VQDTLCHRTSAVLAVLVGFALSLLAPPALAQAASVSVRVEAASGPLVPRTSVTLPAGPVAPAGAAADQTCAGDTVTGALDAATGGDWSGQWSAQDGWSIERLKSVSDPAGVGRRWVTYLNGDFLNSAPCHTPLVGGDELLFYPLCGTAATQCFSGGPLVLVTPATAGPGAPLGVQVWETNTTFDNQGLGASQRGPSTNASVFGPDGSTTTDPYYGRANLMLTQKGDASVSVAKAGHVPDRATVCVTDGADGYCGTTLPPPVPFDPLAFCKTTGIDGYCGSPDKIAPVGHITQPTQGKAYPSTGRPKLLKGTVDFDPSQTSQVKLRLMRQSTITVTKTKKRTVTVKRKVNGRTVRKRVVKKVKVKVKQKVCFSWIVSTSAWKTLKKCDVVTAALFKADGDDVWSYEFLTALPAGNYTLDARAQDGSANIDATPELGRNRVTFSVK